MKKRRSRAMAKYESRNPDDSSGTSLTTLAIAAAVGGIVGGLAVFWPILAPDPNASFNNKAGS